MTGTNTDVGKTTTALWLTRALDMAYFKPIETGVPSDYHTLNSSGAVCYEPAFSLAYPTSPHLSAKMSGVNIDITKITLPQPSNLIVEGAGGVFVPLSEKVFIIDLIKQFNLPTLIVARDRLGVLNEVLLTKFALEHHNIPILGVILNKFQNEDNQIDLNNAEELAKIINIDVVSVNLQNPDKQLPFFLKKL